MDTKKKVGFSVVNFSSYRVGMKGVNFAEYKIKQY